MRDRKLSGRTGAWLVRSLLVGTRLVRSRLVRSRLVGTLLVGTLLVGTLLVGTLLGAGCLKNVPQDLATGEDGRQKGATPVKLDHGAARSSGIVTYPGGDRVDWKVIELPKDERGTLRLRLTWTPPRPGLDLSFEVFDDYGNLLGAARPNQRTRSRKTNKTVLVNGAKGQLYVQIYASARGDAGKYALRVEWVPDPPSDAVDWLALSVVNPPNLPAVPVNGFVCTKFTFDPSKPECIDTCPVKYDPQWPGCKTVCPDPVDPENKACQASAPCPAVPDRRFALCKFPACDRRHLDPANPNCEGKTALADDRMGEITDVRALDPGTRITINVGSTDGIAAGWKGVLLDANDKIIRGSEFVVRQVGKNASVVDLKLDVSKVPPGAAVRVSQE